MISNDEGEIIIEELRYGFDLLQESRTTLIGLLNDNEDSDINKFLYTMIISETVSKCYETFFTILFNLFLENESN